MEEMIKLNNEPFIITEELINECLEEAIEKETSKE